MSTDEKCKDCGAPKGSRYGMPQHGFCYVDAIGGMTMKKECMARQIAALRTQLAAANAQVADLKAAIGSPPAGSHPDEARPRGETWHGERANWNAEVMRLRGQVDDLIRDMAEAQAQIRDRGEMLHFAEERCDRIKTQFAAHRALLASAMAIDLPGGIRLCALVNNGGWEIETEETHPLDGDRFDAATDAYAAIAKGTTDNG